MEEIANMRDISEVLKDLARLRKENGIPIEDIQKRLFEDYGIKTAVKTIYGWESGKVQPPLKTFVVLCKIYKVKNIYDLFFDELETLVDEMVKDQKLINKYHKLTQYQPAIDKLLGI